MSARRLHPMEIRPFRDTRVHAGAFQRAVETVINFDGVSLEEAATEVLRMLDAGEIKLKVTGAHAAYLVTERERKSMVLSEDYKADQRAENARLSELADKLK